MSLSPEKSPVNVTQPEPSVNPEPFHSSRRHLVRSAGILGVMTLASRVLGMIRDIVCAKSFGTTWQWDGFIYAFMLPNFFRRLVGEGALSSAFIPVYNEVLAKKGTPEAYRFVNVMATVLTMGLVVFVLAAEVVLNLLLKIPSLPSTLRLIIDLMRVFSPHLYFISLYALGMAILNSHRRFFVPSLGPVLLDIFWIAGVLWIAPLAGPDIVRQLRFLAYALLAAGISQFVSEIPLLYSMGLRARWVWDLACPELVKTFRLILPAVMGFAVMQVNILVDMSCGLVLGAGANSSLWYGSRLMQFPLGVFAIAMGTALLPMVSRQVAGSDHEGARRAVSFALRSIFLIILPSSVGLIVLRYPIIRLLFERGEFDAVSTARTAAVLLCYSIGLFAYSGQKIVVTGFYAVQDTRTPMKLGVVGLLANVILNLILMRFLREAGLALATSISGVLQFALLIVYSNRRVAPFPFREVGFSFLKILLASAGMGLMAWASYAGLERVFSGHQVAAMLIQVFGSMTAAVAVYVALCFLLRVPEMHEAFNWFAKRKAGQASPA